MIEDKFPEKFKRTAYHPSIFVLAWKKSDLEKLFEELMASNTAIKSGEVWLVDEGKIGLVIPLKNGGIETFSWKTSREKNEQWYDYVERAAKESMNLIVNWNLEKTARVDLSKKIWYHLEFLEN